MKKTLPKIMIAAGVLLLLAACVLFVYSRVEDYLAGQRAERLLEQVIGGDWGQAAPTEPDPPDVPAALPPVRNPTRQPPSASDGEPRGYSVIGILEIPSLDRRLAVLDRSSAELLEISVCRYTGSVEEKPERLVIAGHNYRSHFGQISTLGIGDEILFTTMEGVTFRYAMIGMEGCHMSDVAAVQAGDDWDITLLTCQRDRTMRTLVRFREIP